MTGVYTADLRQIRFDGEQISGQKPHEITQLGIARTFQNIRLFPEMTALENVMVGADARHKTSVMGALFRGYRVKAEARGAAGGDRQGSQPHDQLAPPSERSRRSASRGTSWRRRRRGSRPGSF